ncbi:MAG: putative DNA-binding transcriptional regulator AlpA [Cocleimonas sp.]|jgi:predicted DNA-binding transcriptional regulator AlpA
MKTSTLEQLADYLIQAQDAEQATNVHRITLLRWASKGIAPKPQKIGGRWFWRHSEIQQLIAGEWEAK